MTLTSIFLFAVKVILCSLVIYVIAGFVVSLKRALPFFAIIVSIAAIILYLNIQATETTTTKLIILVVLLLMGQLFYQGDGYMNPVVHENLYTLVNVERKWNSWFAEYDDYELHFSPVETGGFFVNTLVYGLCFGAFYLYVCTDTSSMVGLIVPSYVIGMSILDLLYMCGVSIGGILHWILHGLIVIISVSIGLIGNINEKYESIQTKSTYEKCAEFAVLDYNKSYKIEYEHYKENDQGYTEKVEKLFFMHDSSINVSAFFTPNFKNSASVYDDKDNVYNVVYLKEANHNGNMAKFVNNSNVSADPDFKFDSYATAVGGPYKYVTMHTDLISYCPFTETRFFNAYQIDRNKSTKQIVVRHREYLGDSNYKFVSYNFRTDKKERPIELLSITCRFEIEKETRMFKYIPMPNETDLRERTYNNGTRLYGYNYVPGGGDGNLGSDTYDIDVLPVIDALRLREDVVSDYDFVFTMNNGSQTSAYVYDGDKNMVALYANGRVEDAYDAVENNNFVLYRPDYYIYNDMSLMINATTAEPTHDDPSTFKKYTCDYEDATNYIMYAFYDFVVNNDVQFSENENEEVEAWFTADNISVLNIDMTYVVYYNNYMGLYEPYKIQAVGSKSGYFYELTMYYHDVLDITA